MSRDNIYYLDGYTTLDLTETDNDGETPVAGIQDVTLTAGVSMETLYTADSIKAADKMQHEAVVTVDVGYSFFDGEVVSQWLDGSGGSAATSLSDTSDPQRYSITGEFDSANANNTINVTVEGITFEEMPMLDASRGEFAQWDLSGEGTDVTTFEIVDNTSA